MPEAKQNEHMLDLQTGSNIISNQMRPDKIGFKNQKQEDLMNRFIQNPPFFAKKHEAKILRPTQNANKAVDSVLRDARKRFEMELMRTKQREVEEEKELKALEEENNRFDMAIDLKR